MQSDGVGFKSELCKAQLYISDFSLLFTEQPSVAILSDALTSESILFPQLLHSNTFPFLLPMWWHLLQVLLVYLGLTKTTGTPLRIAL